MKILIHTLGADMGGTKWHLSNFNPALLETKKSNSYILVFKKRHKFGL